MLRQVLEEEEALFSQQGGGHEGVESEDEDNGACLV